MHRHVLQWYERHKPGSIAPIPLPLQGQVAGNAVQPRGKLISLVAFLAIAGLGSWTVVQRRRPRGG